jgi:hypothetical protein
VTVVQPATPAPRPTSMVAVPAIGVSARAMACVAALFAAMLALTVATPAAAQPTALCSSCLSDAHCQADADECVPACQARYFSIDPRRRDCLAQCDATRTQCERSALTTCRQRQACR